MRKAYIINIGDELLIGQITNTNASWLADQLSILGIRVVEHRVISDNLDHILDALSDAHESANLLIMTGGLGPTRDDITKSALSEYFDSKLVFNQNMYDRIQRIFSKRDRKVTEAHQQQCFLPENAQLMENKMGTAPGMRFEKDGVLTFSIPGVPYEMKYLMKEHILPEISKLRNTSFIKTKTFLTVGMGESDIAKLLEEFEDSLPAYVRLAYLPSLGQVRLRLTVEAESKEVADQILNEKSSNLESILENMIYGYGDENLALVLQKMFTEKGLKLGTAESCTGGLVARKITSNAGSSEYFNGSVVSYSNELKMNLLNVPKDILKHYGAVSEETVIAMVNGALDALKVDIAVATSGIAGPSGGTKDKPVGTIWLAVGNQERVITEKLFLGKDRLANIEYTTVMALNLVRRFLMDV